MCTQTVNTRLSQFRFLFLSDNERQPSCLLAGKHRYLQIMRHVVTSGWRWYPWRHGHWQKVRCSSRGQGNENESRQQSCPVFARSRVQISAAILSWDFYVAFSSPSRLSVKIRQWLHPSAFTVQGWPGKRAGGGNSGRRQALTQYNSTSSFDDFWFMSIQPQ